MWRLHAAGDVEQTAVGCRLQWVDVSPVAAAVMIHSIKAHALSVGPSPDHTRSSASGLNAPVSRDTPIESVRRDRGRRAGDAINYVDARRHARRRATQSIRLTECHVRPPECTFLDCPPRRWRRCAVHSPSCCCSWSSSTNHSFTAVTTVNGRTMQYQRTTANLDPAESKRLCRLK